MRDMLKDSWWLKHPIAGSGQAPLSDLQPIDQSLELANLLVNDKSIGINNEQRIELAHQLFQYAISFDNPFARIDYGIALTEGNLGLPDKSAADYQFSRAGAELQEPARKGQPRQALAYSILLGAGYGMPKDNDAANSLANQVLSELHIVDLLRLKDAQGDRRSLIPEVLNSLITKGYSVTESSIKKACFDKFVDRKNSAMKSFIDHNRDSSAVQDQYFLSFTEVSAEEEKCIIDLIYKKRKDDSQWETIVPAKPNDEKNSVKKNENKYKDASHFSNGPSGKDLPLKFTPLIEGGRKPVKQQDLEKQSDTGYLNGSPPPVAAGLSTFTVDNKSGGADAIARIYLNGDKPAIRQIYIKSGEKFTAKELTPGRYVLRYRFIGSEDTFEADKIFTLQEVSTDEGTRFTNVSVTLFTVANGNMKVKRVPNEKF